MRDLTPQTQESSIHLLNYQKWQTYQECVMNKLRMTKRDMVDCACVEAL